MKAFISTYRHAACVFGHGGMRDGVPKSACSQSPTHFGCVIFSA